MQGCTGRSLFSLRQRARCGLAFNLCSQNSFNISRVDRLSSSPEDCHRPGISQETMALRDLPIAFSKLLLRDAPRRLPAAACRTRRHASTKASTKDLADLEPSSSLVIPGPSEEVVKSYDPVKRAEARRRELPPSRCVQARKSCARTVLTPSLDISLDRHGTIGDLFIPISLLPPRTHRLVSSSPVLSTFPVCKRPTNPPSPPTS